MAAHLLWQSASAAPVELKITSLDYGGAVTWIHPFTNGVCTVEAAAFLGGAWLPMQNVFTSNRTGMLTLSVPSETQFYRLLAVNTSPDVPEGFNNLINSYSILETIAGKGEFGTDVVNYWQPAFEGGPAKEANLSRPHFAMADDAGNIYIADKDAHAIRKVTAEGRIYTVAGINLEGNGGNKPAPATSRALSFPNGLWVRGDGTFYILDFGNSKIRRVGTDGIMTTLFSISDGLSGGRGLWVKEDESLVYFSSGSQVKKWTPGGGVKTFAKNFNDLGNLAISPSRDLVVTDRGDNRVYKISQDGTATPIAGNGTPSGGGDGALALKTGLFGVRGIWFLPNGGYFLATHEGSQIWYVDTKGIIHLFVNGSPGNVHSGDGRFFRTPGYKVSEVRSITMDRNGNLLITENDLGYVRRIRFLRMLP